MVSIGFIYFFIPVFMALYAAVSAKRRNILCVLGTIVMTAAVSPMGLIPLAVSVFSGYLGGIMISNFSDKKGKSRLFLILTLIINIAVFCIFSYSEYYPVDLIGGFLGKDAVLRLFPAFGAAVYSLHSISYCADIYMGKYKCEHSFFTTAAYIGFFPVLTAGPLLRFDEMKESLRKPELTSEKAAEGIKLFLIGLVEKLALSDNMYELWSNVHKIGVTELSMATAWIGIIAFSLGFFYEFAAFAHMGKGIALMMGFEIPANFRQPFMSFSISEFITRFNRSLYNFCRDYIYLPLSKGKGKEKFVIIPMIIAMALGSFWYGFGRRVIIWAMYLAIIMLIERLADKLLKHIPKWIRWGLMNIVYLIGLPLFAVPDQKQAFGYICAMFGINSFTGDVMPLYLIRTYVPVLLICLFFITNIGSFIKDKIKSINENVFFIVQPVCEIAFLIISTAFLISGSSELFGFLY